MPGPALPSFEVVARHRPFALLAPTSPVSPQKPEKGGGSGEFSPPIFPYSSGSATCVVNPALVFSVS